MRRGFLVTLCLAAAQSAAHEPVHDRDRDEKVLSADMVEAARRFLSSLKPAQRARAAFAVDDAERQRWHYVPKPRRGIALGTLDTAQRHLAYAFLSTALSRQGFLKATGIMALEEVLRRREHNDPGRDPGAYYLAVFGEPSTTATWGWRLEGHHLSLNLTLVDGVRPVEAPAFFGASPTRVTGEFLGGMRVLADEEDLGFRLLASLDGASRAQAIYQVAAPRDILTGPGASGGDLPGLPAARMTEPQRAILAALIDEAVANLPRELAERERARIAEKGLDRVVFTWAGGAAPGQPHYYRVKGPTFVYEYDNTQQDATHVHSVWHALDEAGGDFGAHWLEQHYRDHPHGVLKPGVSAELHGPASAAVEPFRIVGNIYYVGARNIASYLIVTPEGHILLDTGTREMEPVVRGSIEKLGFKLRDIKIMLSGHAHFDHVQGHAAMQRATGARVMALRDDAAALASGTDRSPLGDEGWDPVHVDRVLADGDTVTLGGTTLRAVWAPGHTPGCTVWTTRVQDGKESYAVAFYACAGPNVGVKLVGNPKFPRLVEDTLQSFARLKKLKPDIYLTMHPQELFEGRVDKIRAAVRPHPLYDPDGWTKMIAEDEADFRERVRAERAGASGAP
ncbi:MAG TPA: subclass B3 metallo-beta-lactamase [Haliangiales bacterium]|nr:subclass B3 metallo-beta-lactamase [Haliangiales bacterium]